MIVAPYPVRGQVPPQPVPPPGVRGMAPTIPGKSSIPCVIKVVGKVLTNGNSEDLKSSTAGGDYRKVTQVLYRYIGSQTFMFMQFC